MTDSIRDELRAIREKGRLERQGLGPLPGSSAAAPPPAAATAAKPGIFEPGGLVPKETEEAVLDYGRAALDTVTLGGLPWLGNKLNQLSGKGQSPYEAAVIGEKRSPIATGLGDATGNAALYFATRGLLGKAGVGANTARFGGGALPAAAEEGVKAVTEDKPIDPINVAGAGLQGTASAALGAVPLTLPYIRQAASFLGQIPGIRLSPAVRAAQHIPTSLPKPLTEGLAGTVPGLLEAGVTTGGSEREDALRRERKRRADRSR